MKQISLTEAVASAKMELGIENTTQHDNWLELLANEAVFHTGDQYNTIDIRKIVPIIDGTICLPHGFKTLLGMSWTYPFDDNEEGIYDNILRRPITANYFIGANYGDLFHFSADRKYIIFNKPYNILANKAILLYESYNMDKDGVMFMWDYQERAVRYYQCWKFARKYPKLYARDIRDEFRREWTVQKSWVRSVSDSNNQQEDKLRFNFIFNGWVMNNATVTTGQTLFF